MKLLSRADEILMVAVACVGTGAYSTPVLAEIHKRGGKKLTVGSLWVSLDQLAERGLIRKRMEKRASGKGGRAKVYYHLTPRGVRILLRTREFSSTLWNGVPDLTHYSGN
ncbi:MAG: PadR family transcriptional regulator [Bacteroidetes bacterium]|nr:MAG: PadR family transcriptional regulator [Bacteroidota bacterium]